MDNTQVAEGPALSHSELLAAVRRAWAEVLDLDSAAAVPLDVKFLEAGGSSLLLIMLWEELHPLTGRTLKVSDLFQHSTVRAQAAFLAEEDESAATADFGATERGRLLGLARRAGSETGGAA
ncbi:acyl carrier protein [Kitasatospora sp. NPDC053057]|uniref:acyl carrier protein n=1 Tax=Kitasatospora sp. NPDC053057 TaxID=3364062 RepID=UPI0037CB662C